MNNSLRKTPVFTRLIAGLVLVAFVLTGAMPPSGYAQVLGLPVPGTMVPLSAPYTPVMLQGLTIHPDNPLKFDFVVDRGDSDLTDDGLKQEGTKLIKYFLSSLTIPEEEMWVNLSPYETDKIASEVFGGTEMGRDVLAQDYLLKQITASLVYPEDKIGREFWAKVREKSYARYGTEDVPVSTFNKVWILPEKAVVYESRATNTAFVVESRLKVMLDEDFVASQKASNQSAGENSNRLNNEILREIIIPELEKEVNEGKHFAPLRQIYQSVILATWYKEKLKGNILEETYLDKSKIKGVDVADKKIKEKIYAQYLEAYRKGVYSYIKEDFDAASKQAIPRKYFSGGVTLLKINDTAMITSDVSLPEVQGRFALLAARSAAGKLEVIHGGGLPVEVLPPVAKDIAAREPRSTYGYLDKDERVLVEDIQSLVASAQTAMAGADEKGLWRIKRLLEKYIVDLARRLAKRKTVPRNVLWSHWMHRVDALLANVNDRLIDLQAGVAVPETLTGKNEEDQARDVAMLGGTVNFRFTDLEENSYRISQGVNELSNHSFQMLGYPAIPVEASPPIKVLFLTRYLVHQALFADSIIVRDAAAGQLKLLDLKLEDEHAGMVRARFMVHGKVVHFAESKKQLEENFSQLQTDGTGILQHAIRPIVYLLMEARSNYPEVVDAAKALLQEREIPRPPVVSTPSVISALNNFEFVPAPPQRRYRSSIRSDRDKSQDPAMLGSNVVPENLYYERYSESPRGRLYLDRRELPQIAEKRLDGTSGNNDIFDAGTTVIRVSHKIRTPQEASELIRKIRILADCGLGPRLISFGIVPRGSGKGLYYFEVEKINGKNLHEMGRNLKLQEIDQVRKILRVLIENKIKIFDFKPGNIMLGNRGDETQEEAFFIDPDFVEQNQEWEIAELRSFYREKFVSYWKTLWEEVDPLGSVHEPVVSLPQAGLGDVAMLGDPIGKIKEAVEAYRNSRINAYDRQLAYILDVKPAKDLVEIGLDFATFKISDNRQFRIQIGGGMGIKRSGDADWMRCTPEELASFHRILENILYLENVQNRPLRSVILLFLWAGDRNYIFYPFEDENILVLRTQPSDWYENEFIVRDANLNINYRWRATGEVDVGVSLGDSEVLPLSADGENDELFTPLDRLTAQGGLLENLDPEMTEDWKHLKNRRWLARALNVDRIQDLPRIDENVLVARFPLSVQADRQEAIRADRETGEIFVSSNDGAVRPVSEAEISRLALDFEDALKQYAPELYKHWTVAKRKRRTIIDRVGVDPFYLPKIEVPPSIAVFADDPAVRNARDESGERNRIVMRLSNERIVMFHPDGLISGVSYAKFAIDEDFLERVDLSMKKAAQIDPAITPLWEKVKRINKIVLKHGFSSLSFLPSLYSQGRMLSIPLSFERSLIIQQDGSAAIGQDRVSISDFQMDIERALMLNDEVLGEENTRPIRDFLSRHVKSDKAVDPAMLAQKENDLEEYLQRAQNPRQEDIDKFIRLLSEARETGRPLALEVGVGDTRAAHTLAGHFDGTYLGFDMFVRNFSGKYGEWARAFFDGSAPAIADPLPNLAIVKGEIKKSSDQNILEYLPPKSFDQIIFILPDPGLWDSYISQTPEVFERLLKDDGQLIVFSEIGTIGSPFGMGAGLPINQVFEFRRQGSDRFRGVDLKEVSHYGGNLAKLSIGQKRQAPAFAQDSSMLSDVQATIDSALAGYVYGQSFGADAARLAAGSLLLAREERSDLTRAIQAYYSGSGDQNAALRALSSYENRLLNIARIKQVTQLPQVLHLDYQVLKELARSIDVDGTFENFDTIYAHGIRMFISVLAMVMERDALSFASRSIPISQIAEKMRYLHQIKMNDFEEKARQIRRAVEDGIKIDDDFLSSISVGGEQQVVIFEVDEEWFIMQGNHRLAVLSALWEEGLLPEDVEVRAFIGPVTDHQRQLLDESRVLYDWLGEGAEQNDPAQMRSLVREATDPAMLGEDSPSASRSEKLASTEIEVDGIKYPRLGTPTQHYLEALGISEVETGLTSIDGLRDTDFAVKYLDLENFDEQFLGSLFFKDVSREMAPDATLGVYTYRQYPIAIGIQLKDRTVLKSLVEGLENRNQSPSSEEIAASTTLFQGLRILLDFYDSRSDVKSIAAIPWYPASSGNYKIPVFTTVWRTFRYAENLVQRIRNEKKFKPNGRALVIGSGAGYEAVELARLGLRVDAIDINELAVANTNALAASLGLGEKIQAWTSDGFADVSDKYDIIVFTAPVITPVTGEAVDIALVDEEGRILSRVLAELPSHLTDDGIFYLFSVLRPGLKNILETRLPGFMVTPAVEDVRLQTQAVFRIEKPSSSPLPIKEIQSTVKRLNRFTSPGSKAEEIVIKPSSSTLITKNPENVVIPEGWSYLVSGAHLLNRKWAQDYKQLIYGADLVVREEGLYTRSVHNLKSGDDIDVRTRMDDSIYSLAGQIITAGTKDFELRKYPIQIRVLFPDNGKPDYWKDLVIASKSDDSIISVRKLMSQYYYGPRTNMGHNPVVPVGTRLVKIAQTQENIKFQNGKIINNALIFYFVPEDLLELYQKQGGIVHWKTEDEGPGIRERGRPVKRNDPAMLAYDHSRLEQDPRSPLDIFLADPRFAAKYGGAHGLEGKLKKPYTSIEKLLPDYIVDSYKYLTRERFFAQVRYSDDLQEFLNDVFLFLEEADAGGEGNEAQVFAWKLGEAAIQEFADLSWALGGTMLNKFMFLDVARRTGASTQMPVVDLASGPRAAFFMQNLPPGKYVFVDRSCFVEAFLARAKEILSMPDGVEITVLRKDLKTDIAEILSEDRYAHIRLSNLDNWVHDLPDAFYRVLLEKTANGGRVSLEYSRDWKNGNPSLDRIREIIASDDGLNFQETQGSFVGLSGEDVDYYLFSSDSSMLTAASDLPDFKLAVDWVNSNPYMQQRLQEIAGVFEGTISITANPEEGFANAQVLYDYSREGIATGISAISINVSSNPDYNRTLEDYIQSLSHEILEVALSARLVRSRSIAMPNLRSLLDAGYHDWMIYQEEHAQFPNASQRLKAIIGLSYLQFGLDVFHYRGQIGSVLAKAGHDQEAFTAAMQQFERNYEAIQAEWRQFTGELSYLDQDNFRIDELNEEHIQRLAGWADRFIGNNATGVSVKGDPAMLGEDSGLGGVNLKKVNVRTRQDNEGGVVTGFDDPAQLEMLMNTEGLGPIIYSIQPMTPPMLSVLLGYAPDKNQKNISAEQFPVPDAAALLSREPELVSVR